MMVDGKLTLSFGRGTPQYMAPEMLRNRADHRADIYSLGVILFESLTRKLPFESAVPGTFPVRETDTPPLFPPDFPAHLRAIVERCVRLHPDDRYADVGDMLAEMGQTARPGDSVRWDGVAGARRAGVPPPSSRRDPSSTHATTVRGNESDARQTARELTRGAVEVARGVWDGILTGTRRAETTQLPLGGAPAAKSGPASGSGSSSSAPASSASSPPSPVSPSSTVSPSNGVPASMSDRVVTSGSAHAGEAVLARGGDGEAREVLTLHGLSTTGDEVRLAPAPAPQWTATEGALTIPVPPPVQGGWRGTLFSTFALAVEVLLALGRGILGWLVALIARGRGTAAAAGTGVAHALGRVFVGALRLAVFLIVLLLLGGLTAYVAWSLWGHTG
jgi:hypothetical protein